MEVSLRKCAEIVSESIRECLYFGNLYITYNMLKVSNKTINA